jgi:hypothetical protein
MTRLNRFVLARLLVDSPDPAARGPEWAALLHNRFATDAIPLYAVFAEDGTVLGSITFQGGSTEAFARSLAAWMDEMLAKAAHR